MIKLMISLLMIFMMQLSACTQAPSAENTPVIPSDPTGIVEEQPTPEQTDPPSGEPEPEETASDPNNEEKVTMTKINVSFGEHTYPATLEDNSSAQAFAELLGENGGSLTVDMSDYGSFEKVGPLGTTLPRNDEQITTSAGDIILYQGNSITVYYAQNSWNFTRLGRIDDPSGLREALGKGDVSITFSLVPDGE